MRLQCSTELEEQGFVVLPKPRALDIKTSRRLFQETLDSFPEFEHPIKDHVYVMGGFAALGNPASFHNPFVRRFREWQMAHAIDLVFQDDRYRGYKLEKLFDRLIYRKPGTKPSPESWHRDESPDALVGDFIYGGWTNLSEKDEVFSCIPGSHKQVRGHAGFAKLSKEESKGLRPKAKEIRVPPGCQLIFHEHILHEVRSKESDFLHMRVHCGFRLTHSDTALQPHLEEVIQNQAVPLLKSRQTPPMYSILHWTNWLDRIVEFSERFKPSCKNVRTVQSGKNKGKQALVVDRFMPSLRELELPMYAEYTESERKLLTPSTSFQIFPPGRTDERVTVQLPWHEHDPTAASSHRQEASIAVTPSPNKRPRIE